MLDWEETRMPGDPLLGLDEAAEKVRRETEHAPLDLVPQ